MFEQLFTASLAVQLMHSTEELSTGFHRRWWLFKMPLWVFLTFEIAFSTFWIFVYFSASFPYRETLQIFFLVLMLANGIQHLVWWRWEKRYVPGLATAPLHILVSAVATVWLIL